MDTYENWSHRFSHCQRNGVLSVFYNEIFILKWFWRWHLTILTALRFLAAAVCVLELSWKVPREGPGVLKHQEGGSPSWPFQRADASLKLASAGKSCPLPMAGGEILLVSRVCSFAGAGVVPKEFDPLF